MGLKMNIFFQMAEPDEAPDKGINQTDIHKMDTFFHAAGPGEIPNKTPVINQAIIQRMIFNKQMQLRIRRARKRGNNLADSFAHAAKRRVEPHLGIGIQLQGKQKVGRSGFVKLLPEFSVAALTPQEQFQHT